MNAFPALLMVAGDFGDHMDGGWWVVMMIGMLLLWALVVLAVAWAVRSLAGQGRGSGGTTALEVLDRTLAEGSISIEEYEQRRRVLLGRQADD